MILSAWLLCASCLLLLYGLDQWLEARFQEQHQPGVTPLEAETIALVAEVKGAEWQPDPEFADLNEAPTKEFQLCLNAS